MEGHTDARPIRTARFRSNWDLSAARSIAVLDFLADHAGIPRDRLSIAGYADTAPISSNDSEAGRARNRRVDIVILNEAGVVGQPGQDSPASSSTPAPAYPAHTSVPAGH
jgi:chemotaxis protein MotB